MRTLWGWVLVFIGCCIGRGRSIQNMNTIVETVVLMESHSHASL